METNFSAGDPMITTDKKQPTETPLKHSWGARFKAAREAMNLHEKDAASRLHLKTHIISIIESESFHEGPPAIFMRGYVRSYGRLLNLSDKEIAQALAQMDLINPATTTYIPQPRVQTSSQTTRFINWTTPFVLLGLTTLVGVWWWNTHIRVVPAGDNQVADTVQTTPPVAANTPTDETTPTNTLNVANTATNTAPAAVSITPSTNPPTTAATTSVAPTTTPVPPATAAATTAPVTNPATSTTATSNAQPVVNGSSPTVKKEHPPAQPSDIANAQMSVPEEGLDNETGEDY